MICCTHPLKHHRICHDALLDSPVLFSSAVPLGFTVLILSCPVLYCGCPVLCPGILLGTLMLWFSPRISCGTLWSSHKLSRVMFGCFPSLSCLTLWCFPRLSCFLLADLLFPWDVPSCLYMFVILLQNACFAANSPSFTFLY